MKSYLTLLTMAAVTVCLAAAEYTAPIRSVTVYDSTALVKRRTVVTLPAGKSVITIPGLNRAIDNNSLTAKVISPDVTVSAVAIRYKVQPPPPDAEVTKLRLAMEAAGKAVERNQDQQKLVRDEIERLKKSVPAAPPRKADGKPQQYDPAAAEAFLNYIETSLDAQYKALRKLEHQWDELQKKLTFAKEAYNKVSSQNRISRITAELSLNARKAVKAPLELTYLINNASWYPAYEIRVNPDDHKVQFSSFAILRQTTGENWQNVPLCFSTAIPSLSADLPQLTQRKITERFVMPSPPVPRPIRQTRWKKKTSGKTFSSRARVQKTQKSYIKQQGLWKNTIQFNDGRQILINAPLEQVSDDVINYRTASGKVTSLDMRNIKQISAVSTIPQGLDYPKWKLKNPASATAGLDFKFHSAAPVNALSDGQYQKIPLSTVTLPGDLYYYFIPHYSPHAYRKCDILPDKTMAIPAGPAGIFYGSEFIGNTDLATILPSEARKFSVNVGVDQRIKLKRTVQQKAEDTGLFTDLRKTSFRIENVFLNSTGKNIRYEIIEQVPATSTDKIKILNMKWDNTLLKHSGTHKKMLTLPAGATAKHVLTYAIEYPADYIITHRNRSSRPMPGFGLEETQK